MYRSAILVLVIAGCRVPALDGLMTGPASDGASKDIGAPMARGTDLGSGATGKRQRVTQPPVRAAQRCFPDDTPVSRPRPEKELLDRASGLLDGERHLDALVCAEEATRAEPLHATGHWYRALALVELERLDEAESAMLRALVINPDDPLMLVEAAQLFADAFDPSADNSEIALELARRAQRRLGKRPRLADRPLLGRAVYVEGLALGDLGRAREALARLDVALGILPDDTQIRFQRGMALFELCRFDDARRVLADAVVRDSKNAAAHNQLGLVLERLGDQKAADRELALAQKEDPAAYPPMLDVSTVEFARLVRAEADALPTALQKDLARVTLETADLPAVADLTAEEPPLSPTILGMFRGVPLAEAPDREERVIILYRKNLLRAVKSKDELIEQIRTTLHHELGHVRGEDDDTLRARGLE